MAAVTASCRRPSGLHVSCSLCCFWMLLLSIHVPRAGSLSFDLRFSKPQSPNLSQLINCTGDALLTQDTLELTRNRLDQSSTGSVGRAKYMQAVRLWDGATGETASFTTTFSFRIIPDARTYPGDGMAFFLGHFWSDIPRYSGGGSLGLFPGGSNGTGDGTIVAVEFDTFLNPENADVSYSHVAIDVNSINSTAVEDTTSPTKNLTSAGYVMMATVRYVNVTRLLAVQLTINGTSYNVNATVDLRSYLPEHVAVGFSAATGIGGELHQILSWSFTSTLQEPPAPAPAPAPTLAPAPAPAPPPPRPPPLTSDNIQHPNKRSVGTLTIAVLVPLLFLLACAGVLAFFVRHKRNRRRRLGEMLPTETSDDDNDYQEQDNSRVELERGVAASGPRRYAYRDLAAATNNFAEDGKLGRGGFGSVYRGTLTVAGEERPVAIKMLSSDSSAQGRKEFEAEVRIISRLKHRNLVQLLGWCDSRHGLLLVYELVAQGSLDRRLHSSDGGESFLTWPERYQIILGLGSALRYLHQEWEQRVVHGDIKPSNIMLDDSLGAKLGDFGLARLSDHGGRWQTTKAVLGTAGYIDPEFVNTRHPSTHADVYSFGIVLLEVVSGRSPVVLRQGEPPFVLLKWVWGLYGRNAILDAVDERLRAGDELHDECMERVLVVGLWCAHPDQSERPSIAQAMHVLQSEDARFPALPPQMYKAASDLAVTGRSYGALSIESYSGGDSSTTTTTTTTTGDSKLSSGSSTTALLRDTKERA
ncbi:L-type lectin-domain containing receptor kinase IX.1-like [Miscanthus floridulus]|uniref:L-type lectin-domain containing receptor kinase IX.1-like n=1 Tax=Miscanthus floridulus TaxID=154761 RepID=UPI00345AFC37